MPRVGSGGHEVFRVGHLLGELYQSTGRFVSEKDAYKS